MLTECVCSETLAIRFAPEPGPYAVQSPLPSGDAVAVLNDIVALNGPALFVVFVP
ncbi:hypothetical protein BR332_005580 [Escherichia coli]|nr:hypothetical protein [Escherichia coli]EFG1059811.1 hypothetical protein [Escherichia coli]HCB7598402.1 hypothetical protein [Escherichia coli]